MEPKNRKISYLLLPLFILGIITKSVFLPILILLLIFFIKGDKEFPDFFNKLKAKNLNFKQNDMDNIKDAVTINNLKAKKLIIWSVILVVALVVLINSIVVVKAGETGVFSLFGRVKEKELSSGIHLINPLGRVDRMSIRTEEYTMSQSYGEGKIAESDSIKALTKEGLNIELDITVLYKLKEEKASDVLREVGLNYEQKIIRPSIRSTIRGVIANYEAKDVYSQKRSEANMEIETKLKEILEERGMNMEKVLLRNVDLPQDLAQAIQEKLQAEQEAQKYDFVLQREQKEKERKIIEAEGQRDAQRIINESLTPTYLNYLYIQELKNREGTIYVPTNPQTGLPVFVQGQ
ncbi:MAG: prohibitin family protein [Candidatus Moranbacteria bacterium]|nr:prohibitin family protein [Candidatus Moranbacteria bacterium]